MEKHEELIAKTRKGIEEALWNVPYVFRQSEIRKQLDGLSSGVMSNFDCAGCGPKERLLIGRKIAYSRDSYIEWLMARIGNW